MKFARLDVFAQKGIACRCRSKVRGIQG